MSVQSRLPAPCLVSIMVLRGFCKPLSEFESPSFRMKEFVYRDLECLVDLEGEPIRIYVPKDEIEKYDEIYVRGYESGRRLLESLKSENVI